MGNFVSDQKAESDQNFIYYFPDKENVDGLIIFAAGLGANTKLHLEVLSQLQDRYRDLPLISIGRKIDGIGNILIDNKTGIKDLLKHLFVHHGYRKIVFVRGPEWTHDANTRFEAIHTDTISEIFFFSRVILLEKSLTQILIFPII